MEKHVYRCVACGHTFESKNLVKAVPSVGENPRSRGGESPCAKESAPPRGEASNIIPGRLPGGEPLFRRKGDVVDMMNPDFCIKECRESRGFVPVLGMSLGR